MRCLSIRNLPTPSFRQSFRSFHLKSPCDGWRSGVRLSPADRNRIFPLGDDRFSGVVHHAQVAVFQLELNLLRFARLQVHALESAQRTQWRSGGIWESEIELCYLVAFEFSSVCYCHFGCKRIACID